MNKTVYIDTAELDAITRRLDYVNGTPRSSARRRSWNRSRAGIRCS
jgi:hypothetical protein